MMADLTYWICFGILIFFFMIFSLMAFWIRTFSIYNLMYFLPKKIKSSKTDKIISWILEIFSFIVPYVILFILMVMTLVMKEENLRSVMGSIGIIWIFFALFIAIVNCIREEDFSKIFWKKFIGLSVLGYIIFTIIIIILDYSLIKNSCFFLGLSFLFNLLHVIYHPKNSFVNADSLHTEIVYCNREENDIRLLYNKCVEHFGMKYKKIRKLFFVLSIFCLGSYCLMPWISKKHDQNYDVVTLVHAIFISICDLIYYKIYLAKGNNTKNDFNIFFIFTFLMRCIISLSDSFWIIGHAIAYFITSLSLLRTKIAKFPENKNLLKTDIFFYVGITTEFILETIFAEQNWKYFKFSTFDDSFSGYIVLLLSCIGVWIIGLFYGFATEVMNSQNLMNKRMFSFFGLGWILSFGLGIYLKIEEVCNGILMGLFVPPILANIIILNRKWKLNGFNWFQKEHKNRTFISIFLEKLFNFTVWVSSLIILLLLLGTLDWIINDSYAGSSISLWTGTLFTSFLTITIFLFRQQQHQKIWIIENAITKSAGVVLLLIWGLIQFNSTKLLIVFVYFSIECILLHIMALIWKGLTQNLYFMSSLILIILLFGIAIIGFAMEQWSVGIMGIMMEVKIIVWVVIIRKANRENIQKSYNKRQFLTIGFLFLASYIVSFMNLKLEEDYNESEFISEVWVILILVFGIYFTHFYQLVKVCCQKDSTYSNQDLTNINCTFGKTMIDFVLGVMSSLWWIIGYSYLDNNNLIPISILGGCGIFGGIICMEIFEKIFMFEEINKVPPSTLQLKLRNLYTDNNYNSNVKINIILDKLKEAKKELKSNQSIDFNTFTLNIPTIFHNQFDSDMFTQRHQNTNSLLKLLHQLHLIKIQTQKNIAVLNKKFINTVSLEILNYPLQQSKKNSQSKSFIEEENNIPKNESSFQEMLSEIQININETSQNSKNSQIHIRDQSLEFFNQNQNSQFIDQNYNSQTTHQNQISQDNKQIQNSLIIIQNCDSLMRNQNYNIKNQDQMINNEDIQVINLASDYKFVGDNYIQNNGIVSGEVFSHENSNNSVPNSNHINSPNNQRKNTFRNNPENEPQTLEKDPFPNDLEEDKSNILHNDSANKGGTKQAKGIKLNLPGRPSLFSAKKKHEDFWNLPENTKYHYQIKSISDFVLPNSKTKFTLFSEHFGLSPRREIIQGKLGDCWLIGAINAVYSVRPSFIKRLFSKHNFSKKGQYIVKLYLNGDPAIKIILDDYFFFDNEKPAFAQFINYGDKIEIWPALLEKAFAKVYNGYGNLVGGTLCSSLMDLTGGFSFLFNSPRDFVRLKHKIFKYAKKGYLMGAGTPNGESHSKKPPKGSPFNIQHAYTILDAQKIQLENYIEEEKIQKTQTFNIIQIKDPWGNEKMKRNDPFLDILNKFPREALIQLSQNQAKRNINILEKDSLIKNTQTDHKSEYIKSTISSGLWMYWKDLEKYFADISVCKIYLDSEWCEENIEGSWEAENTGINIQKQPQFFEKNPSFRLSFGTKNCITNEKMFKCSIILQQKIIVESKEDGEYIFKKLPISSITFHVFEEKTKKRKQLEDESYVTEKAKYHKLLLDPMENYIIVVSTYEKEELGKSFILRIFYKKIHADYSIQLKKII